MNNNRQFIKLRLWWVGLMVVGSMLFGGIIDQNNYAFAADKSKLQPQKAIQPQSLNSIDPKPLLAFVKAMGVFDNAPKSDKAQLHSRHQELQRLSPAFLSTAKAVVKELKAKGLWDDVDQFLYAEAAKDKLPAQLMAEVKSVGGPKVILENLDRFIAEDLKKRLDRTAASKHDSIFTAFGFVGTAYAGTGCSIGAWGANGIMKVFGWLTKKNYSDDIMAANLEYCM